MEHIKPCAADTLIAQHLQQRLAIHQRTTPGVDEDGFGLHQREFARTDNAACLRREAHVQRHKIRAAQHVITFRQRVLACAPLQYRHAECKCKFDHVRADRTHAQHHQGLAVQLAQHVTWPLTRTHGAVYAGNLARYRQHQCQRMLCHGNRIGAGYVAHGDAATRCRRQIDIVGAHAPHRDHAQIRAGCKYRIGKLRIGADVDGDPRAANAACQFGTVICATLAKDLYRTQFACALMRRGPFEYRRKIIRHSDQRITSCRCHG